MLKHWFNYKRLILISLVILWGVTHLFLEFFFQITKTGFLDNLTSFNLFKTIIYSQTTLFPYLLFFGFFVFLFKFIRPYLILTFLLTITGFMIIENFTYTFFAFNLDSTEGPLRFLYIPLFFAIWSILYKFLYSFLIWWRKTTPSIQRRSFFITTSLILPFPLLTLIIFPGFTTFPKEIPLSFKESIKTPSILFIGIDGLNADYLTAYGSDKKLTPHIDQFFTQSLLAENAFSNSGNTYGSTLSLVTGKSPVDTKVSLSTVTTLKGDDQYNHFLAILRQIGYRGIQLISKSASSKRAQLKNGFNIINGQTVEEKWHQLWWLNDDPTKLFLNDVFEKIGDRIDRLSGVENSNRAIFGDEKQKRREVEMMTELAVERAQNFIKQNKNHPFFLNIHLLITHGTVPHPKIAHYSKGLEEDKKNWEPFYMDALIESDLRVKEILDLLKKHDLLNKSIVIFYSDHGRQWQPQIRVPLMIRFPYQEHVKRIASNVQLLDVVPTLLDYMGINKPEWIKGDSLLDENKLTPNRPIYIVSGQDGQGTYSFKYGLIECQNFYLYNKTEFIHEKIIGHTAPCEDINSTLISSKQKELLTYFRRYGHPFNKIDLPKALAISQQINYAYKARLKKLAALKKEKELKHQEALILQRKEEEVAAQKYREKELKRQEAIILQKREEEVAAQKYREKEFKRQEALILQRRVEEEAAQKYREKVLIRQLEARAAAEAYRKKVKKQSEQI